MSNVEIWERIAPFWDAAGVRDEERDRLTMELLALEPGERVLEIGCGSGRLAGRVVDAGVEIVATDAAQAFVDRAGARLPASVRVLRIDATDEAELSALGERSFDAAVAGMVLMNLPTLDPLFAALARLLRPGGRFVFTVVHPCFAGGFAVPDERRKGLLARAEAIVNAGVRRRLIPRRPVVRGARLMEPWMSSRARARYLKAEGRLGIFVLGQPEPHWNYHRPLGALLGPALAAGFMLDALEEPPNPDSSGLPGILAARLRLPTA